MFFVSITIVLKKPRPASSEGDHLLRNYSSSSDQGSKQAAHQVFFKRIFKFPKMFDIEALKNVGNLATLDSDKFGKTVVEYPTSSRKGM